MNLTRWRTASLLAGALIVGTIVGPPLAQAATAGLARIEGGGSSNVVKVASTGQLQIAQADPKSLVAKFSAEDCNKGGIYKVPAGKALILTAVTFFNGSTSPSTLHALDLTAGPPSAPCNSKTFHLLAAQITADVALADDQTFPSGIAVPAGDAIGLFSQDGAGAAEIYGYLVPASAVPHDILPATHGSPNSVRY
jgi:hypothetical protein